MTMIQSDHSTGKPGKVVEFQSGQGTVRGSEIRCVFSSCKFSKTRFQPGLPDPAGGAYDAPQIP